MTVFELIAAGSTVSSALFAIWKWIVPFTAKINKSLKKIDFIFAEVNTNGGSSIKDAINKLEVAVNTLKDDLVKMDARQWAIVSSLAQPTWESDPQGECQKANMALLKLFGSTIDDIKGAGWQTVIHFEDRRRVSQEWEDAMQHKRIFNLKYKIVNAITGSVYEVEGTASPYFDNNRRLIGWVGIYEEVKELPNVLQ
jgi:PAS domain S-box-containing protein